MKAPAAANASYETSYSWNSEPQNVACRMSNFEGWIRFAQSFYYKIDRSTQKLTTGRIHYFDTCPPEEDSIFIIRHLLFQSFFRFNCSLLRPATTLNLEP